MNIVKSIRTRLNITQAALAEVIGCTQGNVGHYENKGQTIPPEVAKRLLAYANQHGLPLTYDDVYGPVDAQALANQGQGATQTAAQGA